jgi:hypothetical protein
MAQVFVSHRGEDTDMAERLAMELRHCGHEVWLDLWRLDLGDSIVSAIDDGLAVSSYLVLCYSSAGVHAPWMSREWMSTLARQLNGQPVKILPIRLTGGTPPAILADVKYADLVTDWSAGVAALCKALE